MRDGEVGEPGAGVREWSAGGVRAGSRQGLPTRRRCCLTTSRVLRLFARSNLHAAAEAPPLPGERVGVRANRESCPPKPASSASRDSVLFLPLQIHRRVNLSALQEILEIALDGFAGDIEIAGGRGNIGPFPGSSQMVHHQVLPFEPHLDTPWFVRSRRLL